jgi:hypothetical protein
VIRETRVVLAGAHLDHDPANNRLGNLRSLCQRCHLIHDRPQHLAPRRITYLLRRALGDLFLGPYSVRLVAPDLIRVAASRARAQRGERTNYASTCAGFSGAAHQNL